MTGPRSRPLRRRPPRRRRRSAPAGLAAALLTTAALAGCGSAHQGATSTSTTSSPAAATGSLSVSPARPTTGSAITFAFTAPVTSGVHAEHEIDYSLSITGPRGSGCNSAHEAPVPSAQRGRRAAVRVGPSALGEPWCPGHYTARAIELERAHCRGSTPCPQYIRDVGIVARAAFSVSRSTGS